MMYLRQDRLYELIRQSVTVIRARGQLPQLLEESFYNAATSFVRTTLQPVTPSSARNKYEVRKSSSSSLQTRNARVTVEILNTDPAFGTYLHGSATRNLDDPGDPYPIFPKKPGGFLKIPGPKMFSRGPKGERMSPARPSFNPTDLFMRNPTRGQFGRVSGGVPIVDGEPLTPEEGVFVPVKKVTYKPGGRLIAHMSNKRKRTFRFAARDGVSKSGKTFTAGDMIVKYVSKHPGRLPDMRLRDTVIAAGDIMLEPGASADSLPGALLSNLERHISHADDGLVTQESKRSDLPNIPGVEHRYKGYHRVDGTDMPSIYEINVMLNGTLLKKAKR